MNGTTNEAAMSFRINKSEKISLLRIGVDGAALVAMAKCKEALDALHKSGGCQFSLKFLFPEWRL
jgi:hypothetical protein